MMFGHPGCPNPAGPRETHMTKLLLETSAPFQGLPEIVADEEGLFEKEGLEIEWVDRNNGVRWDVAANVVSPKGLNPFLSHGKISRKVRPICTTRANGATTAAFRKLEFAVGRWAAARLLCLAFSGG